MKYLLILLFSVSANAALIDPTPSPSPMTWEDSEHAMFKTKSKAMATQLINFLKDLRNEVWNNHYHTPDQVLGALKTDCASARQLSLALASLINSAEPGAIPASPGTVPLNQDGSCGLVVMPSPSPSP